MENNAPTNTGWAYREISVFDRKNPRSVINLLPAKVKKAVESLEAKWFTCSAKQLDAWCHPTEVEERLRITFWHEYGQAQDQNRPINMKNVIAPVCTREYFYRVVVRTPSRLAYVMNPPAEYQIQVEEMLNLGLRKLRDVLNMPLKTKKGEPDHKLINELVKITMFLDNRVKGAVTQRLQVTQQSLNVNLNKDVREEPKTMAEIEKELKSLDHEMKSIGESQKLEVAASAPSRAAEIITVEAAEVSTSEEAEEF